MSHGLPRHVGVNAVFLAPGMAGMDTFVRELIPELARRAPGVRFSLFLSAVGYAYVREAGWADGIQLVMHPLLGRPGLRAASEVSILGALAGRRGVDLLHSVAMTGPFAIGAAHVLGIPDAIWLDRDSGMGATARLWRAVVPIIARRSDRIMTLSQAARRDLVERLGLDEALIDVVAPGFGSRLRDVATPAATLRQTFGLGGGPVVLTVSAKKPYKNLERLVEAWPAVVGRHPDARLVLPGAPTRHEAILRALALRLGIGKSVHFAGFVSDEDLEGLYQLATCFVFPSLREGFGLPLLEAMRRDVPVASSSASALPEVGGEAALYFSPTRPEEIAQAMLRLLEEPALREQLIVAGRQRAASFTWARSADATLAVYERALARRRRARRQ